MVQHTLEVIEQAESLQESLIDIETGQRGYLYTGKVEFLEPYYLGLSKVDKKFKVLKYLTSDNQNQQKRLELLKSAINEKVKFTKHAKYLHDKFGYEVARKDVTSLKGKMLMDSIRQIISDLKKEETRLLEIRQLAMDNSARNTLISALVLLTIVFITFFILCLLFIRDAAKRNQLQEILHKNVAELTGLNKELETFSYSVSHDLRAPLRAIDGFSRVLLKDYSNQLDETGTDYLNRIYKGSQRMGELIDDMLSLSKVTRTEPKKQKVNLSNIAKEIVVDLQDREPDRKASFVIPDGAEVIGDNQLLRQVLENLLGNAWKFTSKKPLAQIEFGTFRQEDKKQVYFIRDNGIGFDMAHSNKLFGVFKRLHSQNDYNGSGIGLATVQRIIHKHGGRVWAEGKIGDGATFYFTLQ